MRVGVDNTLEEALKLFELPRTLGDFEDTTVVVNNGKFGPYIRHDNKFISIPKHLSPQSITLEEAIELMSKPQGAIFLGAHIGSWEVGSHIFSKYDKTMNILMVDAEYQRIKNVIEKSFSINAFFKIFESTSF